MASKIPDKMKNDLQSFSISKVEVKKTFKDYIDNTSNKDKSCIYYNYFDIESLKTVLNSCFFIKNSNIFADIIDIICNYNTATLGSYTMNFTVVFRVDCHTCTAFLYVD